MGQPQPHLGYTTSGPNIWRCGWYFGVSILSLVGCFPDYSFDLPEGAGATAGTAGSAGTSNQGGAGTSSAGMSGSGGSGASAANAGSGGTAALGGMGGTAGTAGSAGTSGTAGSSGTGGTGGSMMVTCSGPPTGTTLDSFGASLSNWTGDVASYSVMQGELRPKPGGTILYNTDFAPGQNTFVTIATASTSGELAILLDALGGNCDRIEVALNLSTNQVEIRQCTGGVSTTYQSGVSVNVTSGGVFGAVADPEGVVSVFYNGTCVTAAQLPNTIRAAAGGKIGLFVSSAISLRFDDFGGGQQ